MHGQTCEEESVKAIASHLLIHDYHQAALESHQTLVKHSPQSPELKKAILCALAEDGQDQSFIFYLNKWGMGKKEEEFYLLEKLAWSVLKEALNAEEINMQLAAIKSACATNDIRAVQFLKNQMRASNAFLRAISVQLASQYGDRMLIDTMKELLEDETVWFVRLEIIKALGQMEIKEVKEPLKQIISHSRVTAEEKAQAITSLVSIYESIDDDEFRGLIHSNRAGIRQLATQITAHLDLKNKVKEMIYLLDDTSAEVRTSALNTLSLLGIKDLEVVHLDKIALLMEDESESVAITAAFVGTRFCKSKAQEILKAKLGSKEDKNRFVAAFILGSMENANIEEILSSYPDEPFIHVNAALGMIARGKNLSFARDQLYHFLTLYDGKIERNTSCNPLFSICVPSKLYHVEGITQYPMMKDQLNRLELLNTLAILNHPEAENAIKHFLKHPILGVTYAAASTLLKEGNEHAIEILNKLLYEEDKNIRIQAALVLSLYGKDQSVREVLKKAYHEVDPNMKVNILGAMGHFADKDSIPFLLEVLEEPHQLLKTMAASALIRSIYE